MPVTVIDELRERIRALYMLTQNFTGVAGEHLMLHTLLRDLQRWWEEDERPLPGVHDAPKTPPATYSTPFAPPERSRLDGAYTELTDWAGTEDYRDSGIAHMHYNDGVRAAIGWVLGFEPAPLCVLKPDAKGINRYARFSTKTSEANCPDCQTAKRHAYSDATTAGFFYTTCERHRKTKGDPPAK